MSGEEENNMPERSFENLNNRFETDRTPSAFERFVEEYAEREQTVKRIWLGRIESADETGYFSFLYSLDNPDSSPVTTTIRREILEPLLDEENNDDPGKVTSFYWIIYNDTDGISHSDFQLFKPRELTPEEQARAKEEADRLYEDRPEEV